MLPKTLAILSVVGILPALEIETTATSAYSPKSIVVHSSETPVIQVDGVAFDAAKMIRIGPAAWHADVPLRQGGKTLIVATGEGLSAQKEVEWIGQPVQNRICSQTVQGRVGDEVLLTTLKPVRAMQIRNKDGVWKTVVLPEPSTAIRYTLDRPEDFVFIPSFNPECTQFYGSIRVTAVRLPEKPAAMKVIPVPDEGTMQFPTYPVEPSWTTYGSVWLGSYSPLLRVNGLGAAGLKASATATGAHIAVARLGGASGQLLGVQDLMAVHLDTTKAVHPVTSFYDPISKMYTMNCEARVRPWSSDLNLQLQIETFAHSSTFLDGTTKLTINLNSPENLETYSIENDNSGLGESIIRYQMKVPWTNTNSYFCTRFDLQWILDFPTTTTTTSN